MTHDLLGRRTSTPFQFTLHQDGTELQNTVIIGTTGKGMSVIPEAAPDAPAADSEAECGQE